MIIFLKKSNRLKSVKSELLKYLKRKSHINLITKKKKEIDINFPIANMSLKFNYYYYYFNLF